MTDPIDPTELQALLANGWNQTSDPATLTKSFEFGNFGAALGWMVQAGLWAEKLNHHPEWSNTYNKVDVTLTTHDAGTITGLDVKLAQKMDKLAQ